MKAMKSMTARLRRTRTGIRDKKYPVDNKYTLNKIIRIDLKKTKKGSLDSSQLSPKICLFIIIMMMILSGLHDMMPVTVSDRVIC